MSSPTAQAPLTSAASPHPSGSPQRWRVIGATFLTYLYDSYDLAILAVVMPVLLTTLGIDLTQGGFLSSATMIGAALGSILFGILAENRGRKNALVIALVWFGVGTLCIYLVHSFVGWLILRFVTGIAIGGVWGPCVALVARHWAPKYMARATAFMLSTFALGWIAASFLGRFVLDHDYRLLFLFGGTSILAAALAAWLVPNDRPHAFRRAAALAADAAAAPTSTLSPAKPAKIGLSVLFAPAHRRRTILATLQNVCQMGGFWGVGAWIPTFLVLMYTGLFVGYQLFGWLGDRIGRRNTIAICFALDCITIPIYLLSTNVDFLFWFGPVMGLAFGGVFGVSGSFYAELFPERIRALASGFCFNVGRLGAVVAPFTVGLIGQGAGLAWGIAASPVIFALGLAVTLRLPETLKRPGTELLEPGRTTSSAADGDVVTIRA